MTLSPEIEMPGHASALLAALPEFGSVPGGRYKVVADWGIFPQIMSPLPEMMSFLEKISGELHARFLRQVADMLADRHGARTIVWDEGFTSGAGKPGGALRPDTIVMAWHGLDVARRAAEAALLSRWFSRGAGPYHDHGGFAVLVHPEGAVTSWKGPLRAAARGRRVRAARGRRARSAGAT